MNNKAILLLCVTFVIAASVVLTAAVPAEDKNLPEQAPLQTCVEGETICIGSNSYTCAENNQWLLNESNAAYCDYVAPTVCEDGETTCFGFNGYTCLNNGWILTALNNESCGYVCTPGTSYCSGTDLYLCENNAWSVTEDSVSCGYVAPTAVQKYVLTNRDAETEVSYVGSHERVELPEQLTVTLYSGGVSGGVYWKYGGVPGAAYVRVCDIIPSPHANATCSVVALPLYSEISFDGIGYIELNHAFLTTDGLTEDEPRTVNMVSSVIYSYS